MSTKTDNLRREIEQTRLDLGEDVNALADKVTPSKIVDRKTRKVRSAFGTARDRVMGVVSDTGGAVGSVAQASGELPRNAVQTAKGDPLAVGLIAFGAAWLASSLVPASSKEQQLAASVKDAAAPIMDKATDAAKEVAEALRDPAQEAVSSVAEAAKDSAAAVRDEAQSATAEVTGGKSSGGAKSAAVSEEPAV